ncbi:sulfotransferase 6B1 [Paralichthys olivaceus]|uniref:sulfotransferase 6B1 n=1 Tax=Paralichthys olivaceus TaxID=8255 RepID=UPI00097DC10C|nr:PREDICTED: sulfotransferase 6B1 [Paralichthys olivaceus]XP_019964674.1 PREDICTED: sulfotransferase 6B1 [Paralichthys olivaceus]
MDTNTFSAKLQSRMQMAKQISEEEKLYRYRGVLYPSIMCPEDHLTALENIEAREDDIMLVAYPKCGFNWMVGVVKKIIAEATGMKTESRMPPLIEFLGPDVLKLMDQSPSPRCLGTHMHPDNIPTSFYTKKTKMLVIFRNPKDTLVSFYHFTNNNPVLPSGQSWESFFSHFLSGDVPWGSYFDHALAWEKRMNDPNVMIVTYEELKQDLSEAVRQISSFFGFPLTEAQVTQITEKSSFTSMKESSANSHGPMGNVIFRKGEVGDWRNHFTPEQSREMDEAFDKHLAGTRLGEKLQYQQHCQ